MVVGWGWGPKGRHATKLGFLKLGYSGGVCLGARAAVHHVNGNQSSVPWLICGRGIAVPSADHDCGFLDFDRYAGNIFCFGFVGLLVDLLQRLVLARFVIQLLHRVLCVMFQVQNHFFTT